MTKPLQKQRCLMSSMKVRRAVVLMLSSMSTKRSIKDAERVKRGADTGIQFKNIAPGHKIQQWRKLLSSPAYKTSLTKFLVEEWKGPKQRQKFKDKVLYVTCEQFCFKITQEQWNEAKELESSQEEADTRLLLHALHVAESGKYKAIVITAEDTNVLILCLGVNNNIHCPMYQCAEQRTE